MGFGENTTDRIEWVASVIVDAALKVHRALGPGLLESVYEVCLAHELGSRGLKALRQLSVPIFYEGIELNADLRLDLLVEDCVVVEIKSVERMIPLFEAQALTYLKLTQNRLCLLINFNVPFIEDGIKRIIL
jgi:GxxExxY protein